jgi:acyl dehydratase
MSARLSDRVCVVTGAARGIGLGLGMGDDPVDEDELPYVYEGRGPLAAPSQCVTLCRPPFWHKEPETGISWRRILHGEQSFSLVRPLAVEGAVRAEHSILAVDDKGVDRGAIVYTAHELFDELTGEPLARLRSAEFLRDDGGCGGFGSAPKLTRPLEDGGEPDAVCDFHTSPQAALRYRQASRDYMPIHADPDIAREAGFDRPISHGLNTFGLACRAVLKRFAPRRPDAIAAMAARSAAPAFPGDTIRVEVFETTAGVRFRAHALERDVLVLDRGEVGFGDGSARFGLRPEDFKPRQNPRPPRCPRSLRAGFLSCRGARAPSL